MKKKVFILVGIITICFIKMSYSQDTISPADALDHIGRKVDIRGTIDQLKKTEKVIYLNMDGKYPDNSFTAVILAKDFGNFTNLDSLLGKEVIVSGVVKLFKEKPEIVLEKQEQLKLK